MRGWRSTRAKAKAEASANAPATVDLRGDVPNTAPVEALIVMTDDAPTTAWVGRNEPATAAAPPPPVTTQNAGISTEVLRLLDVVTNMCDHVIEYIDSDRAERRLMLETLTQLTRVITDGAATIAAASAPAISTPTVSTLAEPATEPMIEPAVPMAVEPQDEFFAFAPGERVLGGSMPAGPEPMIDLVEPEPEPDPEPSPAPQPEFASVEASSSAPAMEIAVEVRGRFGDRWVDGFEICEVMTTPDGPRYRLRRRRDGVVLPELFDATNIRHVETFEQLGGQLGDAYSAHPAGKGRINGNGNGSASYWSRS